jgi:ligand-binding SRPBCC domain-containing protein
MHDAPDLPLGRSVRHPRSLAVDFEHRTTINASPDVVFDLCLDVDAHVESMARSGERAITGVTTGRIGLNEEVTWRATHFGIPFSMTSRVTALDRPRRFVDDQVRGPFHRFHHEHVFEPSGSKTVMIDRVSFGAPLGPLGWAVERFVLADYVRRLIETRALFLKTKAEQRPGT